MIDPRIPYRETYEASGSHQRACQAVAREAYREALRDVMIATDPDDAGPFFDLARKHDIDIGDRPGEMDGAK